MKIKKFYFSVGSYTGYTHRFEYLDGKFEYSTWPEWKDGGVCIDFVKPTIYLSGYEDPLFSVITFLDPSNGEVIVDPVKLDTFLHYAKRYCQHWKKSYMNLDIIDGTQWEVDIWTDEFRLKSDGSNAYPGNFESFTWKLTQLTEGKMF